MVEAESRTGRTAIMDVLEVFVKVSEDEAV